MTSLTLRVPCNTNWAIVYVQRRLVLLSIRLGVLIYQSAFIRCLWVDPARVCNALAGRQVRIVSYPFSHYNLQLMREYYEVQEGVTKYDVVHSLVRKYDSAHSLESGLHNIIITHSVIMV